MANQVHPVSSSYGGANYTKGIPDSVVTVLSCSIRFGPKHRSYPIGYVQRVSFDTSRELEVYYEITSYPSPRFGSIDALFNEMSFNDSLAYDGEPATIFPGVAKTISVSLERPMIYSSNILEAVFKISGSGEFTNGTETDFRYKYDVPEIEETFLETTKDILKRGLVGAGLGAMAGLLRPQRAGQSRTGAVFEGALGGALTALMPIKEYVPEKTRYVSLLQQVRPLDMSILVYSPTLPNKVVYGLYFMNGWGREWKISDLSAEGGSLVLMENLVMEFERVRVIKDV